MSEFGKGFIYNLVLFAKHLDAALERMDNYKEAGMSKEHALSLWINGASDHLYDIVVPDNVPKDIAKQVNKLQELALSYGHGSKMMVDMPMSVYTELSSRTCKLAIAIDKWLGVKVEVAEYE